MTFASLEHAAAYFKANPEHCLDVWLKIRWPYGLCCPRCGNKKDLPLELPPDGSCIRCPKCRDSFDAFTASVLDRTRFENVRLSLPDWMTIMLNALRKKPSSGRRLAEALGASHAYVCAAIRHIKFLKKLKAQLRLGRGIKRFDKFRVLMEDCADLLRDVRDQ